MHVLEFFVAGLFAADGVPHFVKGITGERFPTPFGKPSSAIVNVLWGSINFAIAWGLWRYAWYNIGHSYRYMATFGVGVVLMAISLAAYWGQAKAKHS